MMPIPTWIFNLHNGWLPKGFAVQPIVHHDSILSEYQLTPALRQNPKRDAQIQTPSLGLKSSVCQVYFAINSSKGGKQMMPL